MEETRRLMDTLLSLRSAMLRIEGEEAACLESIHDHYKESARNLLHFIAFHRHLHPGLPNALRQRGLCPLEEVEDHLLVSLETVIRALEALEGGLLPSAGIPSAGTPVDGSGTTPRPDGLHHHCDRLFGSLTAGEGAGIMVTLPAEAAERPTLIADLLEAGMTMARINCAHDDPPVWERLVESLRQACRSTGHACLIAMDLAGPKLRTGPLAPQPAVIRARPLRDRLGRMTQPARILVLPPAAAWPASSGGEVPLPGTLRRGRRLRPGARLRGRDASGRWRTLRVLERRSAALRLRCDRSCHFTSGLEFRQRKGRARLRVGPLEPVPGERRLRRGDRLLLTAEPDRGEGTLPCSLPEVFGDLRPGERVLFDDGRIGAVIREVSEAGVRLEITAAGPGGSRLGSDKGINLPDSDLRLPALTGRDIEDLAFATRHADLISYSFVRSDTDIHALRRRLEDLGCPDRAVVLKIENRQAFLSLPRLLLAAMTYGAPVGVMIARGDLAIECGWEALASIQEEILRICAAAHVPCIWATEVLDTMARQGHPTRAEITDAAAGARAAAVMLNKGPNITATVKVLEAIVARETVAGAEKGEPLLSCLAFASNCRPPDADL